MDSKVVRVEHVTKASQPRKESRWWLQTGPECAQLVTATKDKIAGQQQVRRNLHAKHAALYLDLRREGDADMASTLASDRVRVSRNVCHALVQTTCAHIAKNRPRPIFLTTKGDAALAKKAEKLTQFVDGLYAAMGIHEKGQAVFRDAGIFGTGFGHFYVDTDREEIACERVPVDEVYVSDVEARYGTPRQMFRVRRIHRDVLLDLYPDAAEEIERAPQAIGSAVDDDGDMVEVVEAWHLPTGKVRWTNADGEEQKERGKGLTPRTDGRHVVACGNTVLASRPWTHDFFPILPFHWEPPLYGYWGRGLVESVAGKQMELNNLDRDIQTAHKRGGRPVVFLPIGASVDEDDLNNEIGAIIRYDSASPPPGFQVTPTMNPAIYQERASLWQQCFEDTGVSHSNATGQKPAGVEAAVAIREVNDLSGTRFVVKAQAYERWFVDAARICIALARELYDEHEVDLVAKGRAGKFIRSIKWTDVDMADDQWLMDVYPTSLLPTTPSGRLQTITEMMEGGLLDPDEGRALLDFPDIKGARGVSLSAEAFEYAVDVVGGILDGDDGEAADPRCNLAVLEKVALATYLRALREKVGEPALERLRVLLDTVQRWKEMIGAGMTGADIAAGKPMPEAPPPAPMAPPPGGPMPMGPGAGPDMPMQPEMLGAA